MGVDFLVAYPQGEQNVSAPDYGLKGVIGIYVKASAHAHLRQHGPWGSNALSGGAPNGQRNIELSPAHTLTP